MAFKLHCWTLSTRYAHGQFQLVLGWLRSFHNYHYKALRHVGIRYVTFLGTCSPGWGCPSAFPLFVREAGLIKWCQTNGSRRLR
ncbi:hypothetical protein GDO86_013598 [Hymenochirus boettgeri]|uniref:Uncharacterized protein n=1 Tax=Hymenochirus boettgeri TaxID=247094 RepID=A0A8T2IS12_9PIPI|nr:hypothetical protein GDO86_013598 [Hymenochirus boettgeri]